MFIQLNAVEVASLKSIISKFENAQNNTKEPQEQGEGYRSILLSYKVLDETDFKAERQKELIKRYEKAYSVLGERKFLNIIKRVNHMNKESLVKNIKMYAITSLEKEIKKH